MWICITGMLRQSSDGPIAFRLSYLRLNEWNIKSEEKIVRMCVYKTFILWETGLIAPASS